MRIWVSALCLMAASAALASETDYVGADGGSRGVSVFLQRPAEYVAVTVTAESDAGKPEARLAGVRQGRALLIEQARAAGLVVTEGRVRLSVRRAQKSMSSSYGGDSHSSADVTLLKRLSSDGPGVDVFSAAAEIEKRVAALKLPEDTRYRLGDAELVVADPEQARPELLKAIARDVAKTRESLGPAARVTVSGLEGPVVVRARNPREVELFIEYQLAVELK